MKVANPPAASVYTCAWCGICDSQGECENFYNKPMTVEEVDFVRGGYPFNQQGYQDFRAKNVGGRQSQHSYPRSDFYKPRVEDYNTSTSKEIQATKDRQDFQTSHLSNHHNKIRQSLEDLMMTLSG